jgi:hypothetical protein
LMLALRALQTLRLVVAKPSMLHPVNEARGY